MLNLLSLNQKIVTVVTLALIGLGLGIGGSIYYYRQIAPQLAQQRAIEQTKAITADIGKTIDLPTDEQPQIMTVTDVSKLKDQQFFAKASNGDIVLVYMKAKRAILYSPSLHKILNVNSVILGDEGATSIPAKIVLRNGAAIPGLAAKAESTLKTTFPTANITNKDQTNTTYAQTLVVPLNDQAKTAASTLAQFFHGSVADLPSGETKPDNTDIIVILGKDQAAMVAVTPSPSPVTQPSPTPSPSPTTKK